MDEFKQLYIKYEKQIYRYLFFLSGNKFIAEELTQETFLRAFKSIYSFKGRSKLSTWLFQIAKYTFYNYLKKHKNVNVQSAADISALENDLSNKETPEDIYLKKENAMNLLTAIKKLKKPQQDVVILRLYSELSFKEIGEIMNQSDKWARVNFYRAKNRLVSMINGGDADE
ncbi:sigma-70 family RNA polymerase sigma factor [Gracilibacillus caseinilyticus]|uniref:RNA polymerase sigma factor n=1 Tax=Gracilibacillus caseinilyticus TaxID=2932256 RepID=A0ABY4EY36_9BACI|nr:sigma-70 family RNA polymerase sigma factor [Gracilibacillus caseinilyticus]UOQ48767.1 sigma-70 family RNA polymerase sigma factor [Gracilibacillus caseinilyticus]